MPGQIDPKKQIPIGMPWCRQTDYAAFVSIFEDADELPKSWRDYIKPLEDTEREYSDACQFVIRVHIRPETFPAWCAAKGHRVDAKARELFVAERALEARRNIG
jgi:hypothetical protein